MDTKVAPSQCRSKRPKECLTFQRFKNINTDDSFGEETDDLVNRDEPELEILFQGTPSQCSDSKVFDPTNLTEFEHEKMMKLFKQKAVIAYLMSVGCTTHQSLTEMTQYVLENEEPPPFKPKCAGDLKKRNTQEKPGKHRHKHKNRKAKANLVALGSEEPNPKSIEKDDERDTIKHVTFPPEEIRNDKIHIEAEPLTVAKIHRKLSATSFYAFSNEVVKPKKIALRNLREKNVKVPKRVQKEQLKKKVLLPPLDDHARQRYAAKVVNFFYGDINPKSFKTEKQKQEYREQCRKADADWRKYVNEWGLYFPYSGFLNSRHRAIKVLEGSHMAPGMYYPEEYEEIQRNKKINLQRGFDKGVPRFLVKDEFSHITPYSYGDGVFKYEKYMRNNGNVKNSSLPQGERFPYRKENSDPSMATYDFPNSIDTLLKSKKGAFYPKGGLPWHKRRPRSYIAAGYNMSPKEEKPRQVKESDILRNAKIIEERSESNTFPRMVDELNDRNNRYKGKFKTLKPSYHKKQIEETPGPGYYNITKKPPVRITKDEETRLQQRKETKRFHQRTKEEMTNVDYEPNTDFQVLADVFNSECIGPGSYNISGSLNTLSGFRGRFKAGVSQTLSPAKFKVLTERLRGKDIPLQEKLANADL